MKLLISFVVLILVHCVTFGESFSNDLITDFKEWYSDGRTDDSRIQFGKIDEMITPSEVAIDNKSVDYFSNGIFEYIKEDASYAARVDIDNDGISEIATLFIVGSGRYPEFFVLKKSPINNKFKIVVHLEKHLEPVFFSDQLLFIESQRDFNSGRWSYYNIFKIKKNWTFDLINKITKKFHYNLSAQMKNYISSDILNNIAEQDYTFLGITGEQLENFELNHGDYYIRAHVEWTSVGYYATRINVQIKTKLESIKDFKALWGFSIGNHDRNTYFVTVAMDDDHRESAIQNFRINVYDIQTWLVIASEYVKAIESFESY